MDVREARAFDNVRKAIDMHEAFEKVSINNHKSFLPHLAIFKVTAHCPRLMRAPLPVPPQHAPIFVLVSCVQCSRDILKVGDVWATDLSPLELQNAESKRKAESGGSKRIEFTAAGQTLVGMRAGKSGPMPLTQRKEYSTTLALSVLNNLLITQRLRRGDGPIQYPSSRRADRLFGEEGRTKRKSTHIKLEKLGQDYDPAEYTCIKAFIRMMAAAASAPDPVAEES